jgi:hypothetical protein
MKPYRFEIVRRAFGRFGWIFVRIDERGRRVLARSERSWRSRKGVRKAIAALDDAPIFDATKDYLPFPLPVTRFRFVPGVVPLIVDESPVEEEPVAAFGWVSAGEAAEEDEEDDEREAAAAEQEEEAVGAAEAAKPATAKTRAARLRPSRRQAT